MNTRSTKTLSFGVNNIGLNAVFEKKAVSDTDKSREQGYHSIHSHVNYEVFFIIDGYAEVITESEKTEYTDTILIIPPRLRHFTNMHGKVFAFFISFSKQNGEKELSVIEEKINNSSINSIPFTNDLTFLAQSLIFRLNSESEYSEQRVKSYLELVFSDIFEYLKIFDHESISEENSDPYFSLIERFINDHYCDNYGIYELSEKLHLSVRQTSRIVKRLYGEAFTSVIRNKRLSVASVLLTNTDKSVSDIASELGYANQSVFFTSFKNKFSIPPLQYRKKHKK